MKNIKLFSLLLLLNYFQPLLAQPDAQKEILLIGTFHFNNPGADLAKTEKFNVLTEDAQKEFDYIAQKIKEFAPTKVFAEWDFSNAQNLDSLYNLYLQN